MKKSVLEKLSYYTVLTVAIIFIVSSVFSALNFDISFIDKMIVVVQEVAILLMVLVIAFSGWNFARSRGLLWKAIFLVAGILAVVSSFMNIIS